MCGVCEGCVRGCGDCEASEGMWEACKGCGR